MANHALLNNIEHRHLRIDSRRTAALGDDVMSAPTFPAEFRNVQAHYPIVFHKAADGAMQPLALFGFQQGENLFLEGERWDATYVPLAIERQPFLIGRDGDALMVHVDLDHPRVRNGGDEALFRDQGGTTEYLDRISSVLRALHEGLETVPAFMPRCSTTTCWNPSCSMSNSTTARSIAWSGSTSSMKNACAPCPGPRWRACIAPATWRRPTWWSLRSRGSATSSSG